MRALVRHGGRGSANGTAYVVTRDRVREGLWHEPVPPVEPGELGTVEILPLPPASTDAAREDRPAAEGEVIVLGERLQGCAGAGELLPTINTLTARKRTLEQFASPPAAARSPPADCGRRYMTATAPCTGAGPRYGERYGIVDAATKAGSLYPSPPRNVRITSHPRFGS